MHVGAFAEERAIPYQRVVKLLDPISDDMAAATMLKGMTVAYLLTQSLLLNPVVRCFISCCRRWCWLTGWSMAFWCGVEAIGTAEAQKK